MKTFFGARMAKNNITYRQNRPFFIIKYSNQVPNGKKSKGQIFKKKFE